MENYKHILDISPDVLFTCTSDGVISHLSSSFERVTGLKRKKIIGTPIQHLIHDDDVPLAMKNFQKALSGEDVTDYELRLKGKHKVLLCESTLSPRFVDGNIAGVIGIARDVTQWKEEKQLYNHYANLIESSDGAIYSRDLHGNVISWNKASEKLFGYKAHEMIGQNISVILPPESKKEYMHINRKLKNGRAIADFTVEIIRKDGQRLPIITKISPIKNNTGKIIGAAIFARDNRDRERQEEHERLLSDVSKILSSSFNYEETLKLLAKMLVPDMADWSSVHILEGDKLARITVYHTDPEKVKWAENLSGRYAKPTDELSGVHQVVKTGKPQLWPYLTTHIINTLVKDKEVRKLVKQLNLRSVIIVPLLAGKKVLGAITLVSTKENFRYDKIDLKFSEELGRRAGQAIENARLFYEAKQEIEKRKKTEDELRQSRDELEIILKNVADGITVQGINGKLTYANEAAALATGYSSGEHMIQDPVSWRHVFTLEDEEGKPISPSDLPGRRALLGLEENPQQVIKYRNKLTGEVRWSLIKARPIKNEIGEVQAVVNIVNDITERKELERRKDDFISIASHELKTPLTSLKGYFYLLKKEVTPQEQGYNMLNKIDFQINRLAELVHDLLDVSQIQAGKLIYQEQLVDLGQIIRDVALFMQRTSEKHEIVYDADEKLVVLGDRDRLSQVFMNLINNAIKYSPGSNKVWVSAKRDDGTIKVAIKDTGIGIHPNERERIFERFYRVNDVRDKTFPGHGIGLYFSKEIVERHKGKIWVESKKLQGSTFYIELPTHYEENYSN